MPRKKGSRNIVRNVANADEQSGEVAPELQDVDGDVCGEAVKQCLNALRPLAPSERNWVLRALGSYPWAGRMDPVDMSRALNGGATHAPGLAE